MKIIRATTTDKNILFDNTYKEDITIKPYSQIALQHLVFEPNTIVFQVDASNNEITYAVKTGNKRTIRLDVGKYLKGNYQDLLLNIQTSLNADLDFNTLSRNMGLQFKVERNEEDTAKIELEYRIAHFTQGTEEALTELTNVVDDGSAFRRISKNVGRSASMLIGDTLSGGLFSIMPFNKGCGVIRTKIDNLGNKIGSTLGIIDGQNGFYLALINRQYLLSEIKLEDIEAGVYVNGVGDNIRTYSQGVETIHDGTNGTEIIIPVKYDNATSGNDPTKKDVYEIAINNGIITFRQYIDGADDKIVEICGYDGKKDLIPIIGVKGGVSRLTLMESIITYDPFITTASVVLPTLTTYSHTHTDSLGALQSPVNPPIPDNNTHQNYLEFQSLALANFLGFNKSIYDFVRGTSDTNYIWVADNVFEPSGISDVYAVEVLSMPMESYDGITGSKRNFLSYVPVENSEGTVAYEPQNQNFIDLNNRQPISLRHLKMRVLSNNLQPVEAVGTSSIAIVIKEENKLI